MIAIMMFIKSAFALSALLVVASALSVERNGNLGSIFAYKQPAHAITVPVLSEQMSILLASDAVASVVKVPAFSASKSDCDKEDEEDCKGFCEALEQTSTCAARGNKVTCYCKGGKSESNCEERCLLCMSCAELLLSVRRD